jgi:adenylyltransferase/sulfurtransferase
MATKVLIPTPLRQYTNKADVVELSGNTVGELLEDLTERFSPLKKHLFSEDGKLRSFVNVYLNDEDIRYLQKEATKVTEKDVVSIVPSIAGGS